MRMVYKSTEGGLVTVDEIVENCWINLVDPAPEEIAELQSQLSIPLDFLTYPLDLDERPRTEKEDNTILIILRVPYYQGEAADIPYTTIPLGIILTEHHIITVCRAQNGVISDLLGRRIKGLSTGKRYRLVLQIFLGVAMRYLSYLREINRTVELLEDKLQLSMRNRELQELLKYQKSLTYFTTALKSNELMMERLHRSQLFRIYPDDEDLLQDVLTENQQAIEMTNIAASILSQMMDAFASIISNNLNVVMKFLTSFTIILTFPIMLASFYGMNVALPFQEAPDAFWIVLAIALGLSLSVAAIFWRRDWF
ncbi:MAG: magnesium transporter [Ardenticatenia bacterium]|nr:MAG: magnesium transporter [Ardenticatenia bacterium]